MYIYGNVLKVINKLYMILFNLFRPKKNKYRNVFFEQVYFNLNNQQSNTNIFKSPMFGIKFYLIN